MRVNLPVTQNEYILRDDDLIVSRTDTKGRITYINPIFLRTSGARHTTWFATRTCRRKPTRTCGPT
ncbi:MAG: hypothetical protein NTV19_10720 [Burkholderiales bacterium]|nr:hypothetical protein [Burkholderiales bacterium]